MTPPPVALPPRRRRILRRMALVTGSVSLCHLLAAAVLTRTPAGPRLPETDGVSAPLVVSLVGERPKVAAPAAREPPSEARAPAPGPAPAPPPPPADDPTLAAVRALVQPAPPAGAPPTTATAQAVEAPCDISPAVDAALKADPGVAEAAARIPRGARSVANAVLMWDRGWIDLGVEDPERALQAIHAAVARAVAGSAPGCRGAVIAGPRLVILSDAGRTVLAFGSGLWRWTDVASEAPPP